MLIGRADEQQTLARLVASARLGASGVLVVRGEPGIGKSALLEHAAALAEDMTLLRVVGSPAEKGLAFAGLHQLLRPVIDRVEVLPEPQAEALSVALALRPGGAVDRFAVGAGTLTLLTRYAEDRPVLVVVDDLQDLDRPSAEALVFAARRLVADRVGFVFATRPDSGGPAAGLPVLELGGLDGDASLRLLARAGALVPAELADRTRSATGGNPLALLELAKDGEVLDHLSPHVPIPATWRLRDAFGRRLDRLDESGRTALLVVAVADGDLAVVRAAGDEVGVDVGDLAAAEHLGLLEVTPGRAVFRHPLVAACAYASAAPALRRRTHAAVARALPGDAADRRAWHRAEAVAGIDDDAADGLVAAGQRARERGAHAVAAAALERAARLTEGRSRRAERLLAAGECAWLAGRAEHAERVLAEAAHLASSEQIAGVAAGLRGSIAMQAGSLAAAGRTLRDAGERLSPCDPDAAVDVYADLVHVSFHLADPGTALVAARRVEELVPAVRRARVRVRGCLAVGIARVMAGEPDGIPRIRAAVTDLTAAPERVEDPLRPDWSILGPLFLREAEEGRELVSRVVDDVRHRCAISRLPRLLFHTARDQATTARWQQAVAGYQEGIDLAREAGLSTDLTMGLAGFAWLQARMGREQECRENAAEAIRLAEEHQVHLATAWSRFALGELELALARPEAAAGELRAVAALLTTTGFRDVDLSPGPELVEALVHLGSITEAVTVAEDYRTRAEAKGQPWARARAHRALGLVTGGSEQTDHFQQAQTWHTESPDDYEEARTLLAWGSVLRRRRQRAAARPYLRAALAAFQRLGARPWADQAATELDATGETAVRSGDDPVDALTPQELRIAQLLAVGRTTRETATALFLSPKTVEYHLRHVYTKLDIHSRAELAGVMGSPHPATLSP